MMKIKIAIPSKGRISEPSINILEKAGLGLIDKSNRKLISKTFNENIEVMFARASDIPEFVNDGVADMGITGVDLINENEADVEELLDLRFGQTKLVLAAPEESPDWRGLPRLSMRPSYRWRLRRWSELSYWISWKP